MFGMISRRTKQQLETEGRKALATVVDISSHGWSTSTGSLVSQTTVTLKTRLRVEPQGEPSFEVEKRFRYGQLSIPEVGQQLTVRYDPADHDTLIIAEDAPLFAAPSLPGGQIDVGDLLSTIKQTRAQAPGDRTAMADAIKAQLGVNAMVLDASSLGAGAGGAQTAEISQLERLAALHASGALTDAEFAAEKAKVLGA